MKKMKNTFPPHNLLSNHILYNMYMLSYVAYPSDNKKYCSDLEELNYTTLEASCPGDTGCILHNSASFQALLGPEQISYIFILL